MPKLNLICCIALLIAGGCARETPPSKPAAPQTLADDNSSENPSNASRDVPEDVTNDGNVETKITAADAVRIAAERFDGVGKLEPGGTVRLISFRECYQRACDNIHGDPGLQGPVLFGDLKDLDRDGECWSVEARHGGWLVVTYVDEVGNVVYTFNR